jgi:hypothetical protein
LGLAGTATSTGDWFIFGAWVRQGANSNFATSAFGPLSLYSYGATDVFDQGSNQAYAGGYQMHVLNDWWHPVVVASKLATGTASSHNIKLSLYGGNKSGQGNQFWMPFAIYIPASAGVTVDEVERWRQELLHGAVPPGMPRGGGILAMNPAHKLYWGSDTNIYREAAGVARTDGSFDAGLGYECNGSYGVNGQVLGTTGKGCVWIAPSGGTSYPQRVASVSLTGQTAASGGVLYSVKVSGTFRVAAYLYTEVAGTAGTGYVSWNWNNGSSGMISSSLQCSTPLTTLTTAGLGCGGTLHAVEGSAITYATHLPDAKGSPKYGLDLVLERLQ